MIAPHLGWGKGSSIGFGCAKAPGEGGSPGPQLVGACGSGSAEGAKLYLGTFGDDSSPHPWELHGGMGETELPTIVLGQLCVAVCVDAYTIRGEGLRGANSPSHAPSFECVICHVGPPQGLCSPVNTIDCRSISTISPVLIHSPVIRCDVHFRMTPRYALNLTGSLTECEEPVRICRGICAALMHLIRTGKRFGSRSLLMPLSRECPISSKRPRSMVPVRESLAREWLRPSIRWAREPFCGTHVRPLDLYRRFPRTC